MEKLEYLIRTLTYKRSCLELEEKKATDTHLKEIYATKRDGVNEAIDEIYKLLAEISDEN